MGCSGFVGAGHTGTVLQQFACNEVIQFVSLRRTDTMGHFLLRCGSFFSWV